MNPKSFLLLGGVVLVVVGLLGMVGIIGPTAEQSLFGSTWYFTPAENWAHLVLGIVALVGAYVFPANIQKPVVMLVGVIALFFSVYNIFSTMFMGAHLESPMDLLLHLVVGVWAIMAARRGAAPASYQGAM